MARLTWSNLRTQLRRYLGESGDEASSDFASAFLNEALTDAYRLSCIRHAASRLRQSVNLIADQTEYPLESSLLGQDYEILNILEAEITGATLGTRRNRLEVVEHEIRAAPSQTKGWAQRTGIPTKVTQIPTPTTGPDQVGNFTLAFWPTPSAAFTVDLLLAVMYVPTAIPNDGYPLREEWLPAILRYAAGYIYESRDASPRIHLLEQAAYYGEQAARRNWDIKRRRSFPMEAPRDSLV